MNRDWLVVLLLMIVFGFCSLAICGSFDWPFKRAIGLTILLLISDEWATERWIQKQNK